MTPSTAAAMRASLDARIVAAAVAEGVDPGRIRRRLTFQRIVRRIGPENSWVLKGGYLLEARLGNRARSTRDLDLAVPAAIDGAALRSDLGKALSTDPDSDFFELDIGRTRALAVDGLEQRGWRFGITARLADRTFCDVRVDIVERAAEAHDVTEIVRVNPPVDGTGLRPATIRAVDIAQHAAEKFHAMARTYAGGRPSTRVKDLVDIVLMADAGLLPDPRLGARLHAVFASRDGVSPPASLPEPPAAWVADYAVLAAETAAHERTLADALAVADALYLQALS